MIFYIYIALSLIVSFYLVRKHQPKYGFITFVLCFWIFYSDVGNRPDFLISIPGAPFDLQPMRVVFLICLAFLASKPFLDKYRLSPKQQTISIKLTHESFLFVFILLAGLSYVVNFSHLGPANFYIQLAVILRFYVVYYTVRTIGDEGVYKSVRDTIIVVCTVTSLVAIVQVGFQPFFRVYSEFDRPAFGGLIRSTGVFRDDYMHSYITIVGLVWTYFSMRSSFLKNILIGLFLIGIFVAFMRMGYVVTAIIMSHAIFYKTDIGSKLKVLIAVTGCIVLVFVAFWTITSGVLDSSVAQERMLDEGTMELRFALYEKAIAESLESVKSLFFGYGSMDNPAYRDAMYEVTHSELWASGKKGGWHNLYVMTLYFNGFPAMIMLILFLTSTIKYFYRLERITGNQIYLIPFYCTLGYAIANFTLTLTLYTNFAILVSITAGIAVWIREKEINQTVRHES